MEEPRGASCCATATIIEITVARTMRGLGTTRTGMIAKVLPEASMHHAVRALLNQILDYAGLFPPANLPLEEALRIYLHEKKNSPYSWMLGRFVCPTPRLRELLSL